MGDLLFIGSCAGNFYALDKATGQVRWSYDIRRDGKQRSFHGDPLVTDDLILVGTDQGCDPDSVGHVYAFERITGKVRWKYRSTSVPTDIVQLGSNVFFGSFQGQWSSVSLRTGSLNWNFSVDTPNTNCDPIKSPIAYENRFFLIGLDGVIYALDATSGRVAWKRKLSSAPTTSLAVWNKSLYVGTTQNHLYRLNIQTGDILAELGVEATPVGRLAAGNNSLLMFLENRSDRIGYIITVDSELKDVRWQHKSSPEWASERPHLWKGNIAAGNCRGEVAAFRASDGAPRWTLNVKGCIRSIGSSGNMLFIGVQEGTIYAFDLSGNRK